MVKTYRKRAPKRAQRTNRRHYGVPQRAAKLCGVHVSMVYKVRNGQAVSAKVSEAIEKAERELCRSKGRVA